ncbi:thermonuclease family protein [Nostoc sp.]|uniref:thermonuclease family protein n=1 Tax=Nostoc sp. TaxID=1180 RepID=UPI002FF5EF30
MTSSASEIRVQDIDHYGIVIGIIFQWKKIVLRSVIQEEMLKSGMAYYRQSAACPNYLSFENAEKLAMAEAPTVGDRIQGGSVE